MLRRRALLRFLLTLQLTCALALAAGSEQFYLHSGDTVVFYGDSITDQRLYTMLTELYTVTRYGELQVKFVHSGWGGDRVTGGGGGPIDIRLKRDVFSYKPSVMTIMLGMNDGKYASHTAADDKVFYDGYENIVQSTRKEFPQIRITAIGPSPFDDVTRPATLPPSGYNAVLVNYSDWIRRYAATAKLDFADLNEPVVSVLEQANTANVAVAQKIIPDRIHPGLAGHLIMAEALLKAWHARPVVSLVNIDASAGKVKSAQFTTITDLHAGSPFVWTETDEALPLPFSEMLASDRDGTLGLAIKSSDVTESLNEQPLTITGLKPGQYRLSIDGQNVGSWTDEELAKGVNLAVLDTPMSKQAMAVRDLTVRHLDVHQARWRTIQVPLQQSDFPHASEALRDLDALENEIVAEQRTLAKPRPHVFQLEPVT
ncbi:MAG: SGNH/GDSL hydrolase family protein [Acidobacteriaceae bacterium]|nr:SGNH/GDSL hydrolase family protein [Acidobacteriaceae bacterium]MBV9441176.1 SGNH/GDSL hydrolase family protein [Acidobacteriaceae bacterium]